MTDSWPQPKAFVTVSIVCQHCGEVAKCTMPAETARRWAQDGLLPAADGLERLAVFGTGGEG